MAAVMNGRKRKADAKLFDDAGYSEEENDYKDNDDDDQDDDDDSDDDEEVDPSELEGESLLKLSDNLKSAATPASKSKGKGSDKKIAAELEELEALELTYEDSFFSLQVTNFLKEVTMPEASCESFEIWLEELKKTLRGLPRSKVHRLHKTHWLEGVTKPLGCIKSESRVQHFQFFPPQELEVVGSYAAGIASCFPGYKQTVDLAVTMPDTCINAKDYLNYRYHQKRALYLAFIAKQLRKWGGQSELAYGLQNNDVTKSVLYVTPAGKLGGLFRVAILPCSTFPLKRFAPQLNNVRPAWFFGEDTDLPIETPTPLTNFSMAIDMALVPTSEKLCNIFGPNTNLSNALRLLKVWLKRRSLDEGFDGFTSFMMSMYLAYLTESGKIIPTFSTYQILRIVFLSLSTCDWTQIPIAMEVSGEEESGSLPTISSFEQHAQVVFVDHTGFINICARLSEFTYCRLRHEAVLALQSLNECGSTSFQDLFETNVDFMRTFDCFVVLQYENVVSVAAKNLQLDMHLQLAHAGVRTIGKMLQKALGDRLALLDVSRWSVPEQSIESVWTQPTKPVVFGLLLDPKNAFRFVDRGPSAENVDEAKEFREFWGGKAQIRRFPDGAIQEAVVWPGDSIRDRRRVCLRIATFVLKHHHNIEPIRCIGDYVTPLLEVPNCKYPASWPAWNTGEEPLLNVTYAMEMLATDLRSIRDLPLSIVSIDTTSATLRMTEVFPPLPGVVKGEINSMIECAPNLKSGNMPHYVKPIDVVARLEMSGKWPDDYQAHMRLKTAFLIALSDKLSSLYSVPPVFTPTHIDLLKNGYVFRVRLRVHREVTTAKKVTDPNGLVRLVDNDISRNLEINNEILPALSSALIGVQSEYSSFGTACRIAKRWLASQLLLDDYHVSEVAVEIMIASLYLRPAPYTAPRTPRVAFQRFLSLLANHNWRGEPIIINPRAAMTNTDVQALQKHFLSERPSLPPMVLFTPWDSPTHLSPFTQRGPCGPVLYRLSQLAREMLTSFEESMLLEDTSVGIRHYFRPSLAVYDVIITLNRSYVTTMTTAVDDAPSCEFVAHIGGVMPVRDFNPVASYVSELNQAYEDIALFFYDQFGGTTVAVLWKPVAFRNEPVLSDQPGGGRVLNKNGKSMRIDLETVVEDFEIIGRGLVQDIDVRRLKQNGVH